MTAVRIDECGDYSYDCDLSFLKSGEENATPNLIPEEFFLDQPWPVRIMMEADDQFQKNEDGRETRWICKHPEYAAGICLSGDLGNGFENEMIQRIDKERALEYLTEKQRRIYRMYDYGFTQQEIAKKLGTTKQSVCECLTAARKKIAE